MKNTAGQEIPPPFIYPCPKRCNSTGGCNTCQVWQTEDHSKHLNEDGIDEKCFYKKVLKTTLV